DMHVIEPADLWRRYIDPAFRARAPVGHNRYSRDAQVTLDGKDIGQGTPETPVPRGRLLKHVVDNAKYADGDGEGGGRDSPVRARDRGGLEIGVLYPSRSVFTLAVDGMDPALADAIARAYNDWLHEFCARHPDRLIGVGQVSPHNAEGAAREARRCVEELGFRGVFLRPSIHNGRNWFDPYYDPLWATLGELGVPVSFHDA